MKTYLECIPCFFRQALEAAQLVGADKSRQKKIIDEVSRLIPEFNLDSSPPEMARHIHSLINNITQEKDPYLAVKEKSNRLALDFYPRLKNKIKTTDDRLLLAIELAIAGNIIDYGVKNTLDVNEELKKILDTEFVSDKKSSIFQYSEFRMDLKIAKNILYLADNAGEIVFDRILIEEINDIYPEKNIHFAVKEKPIINDALIADAKICGLDKCAKVMSSGCDGPGTILKYCSQEFIDIYNRADLVISKGQGNFEALTEERRPIYFLFMAKCEVVAEQIGCKLGDIILFHKNKRFK